jgi:cbb3-type cytochrome oxidase maturation protein
MESLYLLIPLSVVLVLLIGGVLVWAVMSGQFEELDDAGKRALDDDKEDGGNSGRR